MISMEAVVEISCILCGNTELMSISGYQFLWKYVLLQNLSMALSPVALQSLQLVSFGTSYPYFILLSLN